MALVTGVLGADTTPHNMTVFKVSLMPQTRPVGAGTVIPTKQVGTANPTQTRVGEVATAIIPVGRQVAGTQVATLVAPKIAVGTTLEAANRTDVHITARTKVVLIPSKRGPHSPLLTRIVTAPGHP